MNENIFISVANSTTKLSKRRYRNVFLDHSAFNSKRETFASLRFFVSLEQWQKSIKFCDETYKNCSTPKLKYRWSSSPHIGKT